MTLSLHTLPVDLVYRILDNLREKAIFLSMRNVCKRLNTIIDTYHRYQVKFSFIFEVSSSSFSVYHLFHQSITLFSILLISVSYYDRISKSMFSLSPPHPCMTLHEALLFIFLNSLIFSLLILSQSNEKRNRLTLSQLSLSICSLFFMNENSLIRQCYAQSCNIYCSPSKTHRLTVFENTKKSMI